MKDNTLAYLQNNSSNNNNNIVIIIIIFIFFSNFLGKNALIYRWK